MGVNCDLGVERRFVGIRDPREFLNLAGQGLLVEPLDIALDEGLERAMGVDLDEVLDLGADPVAGLAVGRYGGRDGNYAVTAQNLADEADAANVDVAVLLAETETFGEMRANHVAIQNLHLGAERAQPVFQDGADRGFASSG